MALTKVAGDILDPGLSIAGVVTATAFDGPFRGGSGSDIIAGVGTFTQLDVNGPGDFTGIVTFSHTQDSTSASTGTIQVAGGVGIAKSVYIGGDLVVNGTTTTIDTTLKAVDRIEVADNSTNVAVAITQSGSGDIFNLYDGSTEVFSVTDGGYVRIPDGTNSLPSLSALADSNSGLYFPSADALGLVVGGSRKLLANSSGITINNGDLELEGGSLIIPDSIIHDNDTNTKIRFPDADTVSVETAATERLRITSTGTVGINTTNSGGDGLGIMVDNNSTNTLATGSIALNLKNKNATDNTWVSMDFNNSAGGIVGRFGAQFLDTSDKSTDLYFATRQDGGSLTEAMRIYHENSGSTGMVKITAPNSGDMFNLQNSTGGGQGLIFGVNTTNHTTYWKNNSSSFYDATFILGGSERLRFTGEGKAGIGTTNPQHSLDVVGNIRSHTATPALYLQTTSDTASSAVIRFGDSGSFQRGSIQYDYSGNSHLRFKMGGAGNNVERLVLEGSTGHLTPGAAGTQNLGSTSKEWGDVFIASDKALKLGNSQIGDLYVGSDNVTYLRNSTGQMVIRAAGDIYISDYSGNHRAGFRDNSSVDLYYDIENNATAKLSTTAKGISVHGEVAASQDYPNIRPRLNWNFASEKRLDPRITYTRTGQASYVDEFGIVQTVCDDEPRFDHDPLTGECKGLLIEDARTNQIKDSYDLTQQSWTNININRKSFTTETLAPNGKYEATKIVLSTNANQHYTNHAYMTKANGAERQCISFWAKLSSSNYPILKAYITGALAFTNYSQQQFNLSTGAVTSSGSGSFTNHSAKMTKYPNGWWKCEFETTLDSSETTKRFQLLGNDGSSNAGNGIDGYYIWGVQVEVGDFATSYIPTSTGGVVDATAAATQTQVRGGDQVGMLGDNHTNIWNDQEGSYVIDYTPLERAAGNGVIIGSQRTTNGSGYPWPLYRHDAANSNVFKSYDLDHGIVTISSTWADQRERWALGFNTTNGSIVRNGTILQTNNTNMTGLTNTDQLWLGSSSSGSYYSMHLRRFMYYGKRITNSQLQTMSQ